MADYIKIRGGKGKSLLKERELGFHTDEQALYIGLGGAHIQLCRAEDIEGKLTAKQAEGQEEIKDSASINEVITALNSLISALKESGIMKT